MICDTSGNTDFHPRSFEGTSINFNPLGNKTQLLECATENCSTLERPLEFAEALLRKVYWQQRDGVFELARDLTLTVEGSVVEGVSDIGCRNAQPYEKWFIRNSIMGTRAVLRATLDCGRSFKRRCSTQVWDKFPHRGIAGS